MTSVKRARRRAERPRLVAVREKQLEREVAALKAERDALRAEAARLRLALGLALGDG